MYVRAPSIVSNVVELILTFNELKPEDWPSSLSVVQSQKIEQRKS